MPTVRLVLQRVAAPPNQSVEDLDLLAQLRFWPQPPRPLFCSVVLLGILLPFGWCFSFSFSCFVRLSSFSSFGWCCVFPCLVLGGAAWFPSFFGWCCCFPAPVWWCLPSPPEGGVAFLRSPVAWCCLFSSFFLGGVAFLLSFCVVLLGFLLLYSFLGWCCCFVFPTLNFTNFFIDKFRPRKKRKKTHTHTHKKKKKKKKKEKEKT